MKISATELKIGSLMPELPILKPNDGRILPQTFNGGLLTSKEFKNLMFTGGRLDKAKDRDDSNYEDIALNNKNSRFLSGATGKHFNFGGVDYKFADKITGSLPLRPARRRLPPALPRPGGRTPDGPRHLRHWPAPGYQ